MLPPSVFLGTCRDVLSLFAMRLDVKNGIVTLMETEPSEDALSEDIKEALSHIN